MKLPRRAYDRYMRSPEWIERRARFLEDHPGGCVICGNQRNPHVHHLDYRNLGSEPDDDLIVLCRPHHDDLHLFYEPRADVLTLRQVSSLYVAGNGGPLIDQGEPLTLRNHARWVELVTVPCPRCQAQPGEACIYLHRGRVRIVTAGGAHGARKAAATRARRERASAGNP